MRKFIVKNRQKRKYTRKHQQTHSVTVSKEFFMGFAPLIIIAILLVVSVAIMQIIRDQNISISFTLQMPHISFSWLNPIFVSAGQRLWALTSFLDPRPFIAVVFASYVTYAQFVTRLLLTWMMLNYILQSYFVVTIASSMVLFWQSLASVIVHTYIVVSHTIISVGESLWKFILLSITRFVSFVDQMIYLLGAPFRVLGAFYIQIKPYLDFFMSHVQMTGTDFNRGFHSLTHFGDIFSQH